jgi:lysophospholipase L1-like esterase
MLKPLLLAAALLATPVSALAQAPADPPPYKAVKIVLVGDSTIAVRSGWGYSFCAKHTTAVVACVNLARGGRSTKSYRAEGSWTLAQYEMKSGGFAETYVLVQFGHNDQPGKAERSTDLATEFPANLRRYVEDIRAAGAKPVLVTPLTRRQFKDGRLIDDLGPWSAAIRKVAAEMNVPLVDLNARSMAAVQAMGAAKATELAQAPPTAAILEAAKTGTTISAKPYEPPIPGAQPVPAAPPPPPPPPAQDNAAMEPMGQAKVAFDYTHLGEYGADQTSALVVDELAKAVPALRRNLIP